MGGKKRENKKNNFRHIETHLFWFSLFVCFPGGKSAIEYKEDKLHQYEIWTEVGKVCELSE